MFVYKVMTTTQLLEDLSLKGGAIVGTDSCSSLEIAIALQNGDMVVDSNGMGYVRRPSAWVNMASDGLAARAHHAMLKKQHRNDNTFPKDIRAN